MNKKTIRNCSIFIFIALTIGWVGLLIDKLITSSADEETLGMGIWLVTPLLTTILLRLFANDGWKDIGFKPRISNNLKWYIVSLIIYPLITGIVLILGNTLGWINFSKFNPNTYLQTFYGILFVNFIKNFFEESVWRGYLTAKLLKLNLKDVWLYLIVGSVWGLWHLPYYLCFLPSAVMYQILPVDRLIFALVAIASMICWSVMFIELYRITKSIWPVVLLHMMEDSLINHLVLDGHITIATGKEIFISPVSGIITTALYICVGLLLRKSRIKKERYDLQSF